MQPVPVAEKLLDTKLFGFSLSRLIQAFAIPVTPGMLLTLINMPIIIFGPTILLGLIIGMALYVRTPPGQKPAGWLIGRIKTLAGPSKYTWKPLMTDGGPNKIQVGEDRSMEAPDPQDTQEEDGMIGDANTLENLDFEAVHDDGVIETDQVFAMLVEVTERQWLILDRQSRESVIDSYSQFIMGIKSPIQTLTLPVPYRAEDYTDEILSANKRQHNGGNKILEHGRIQHAQWLENVVRLGNIRDRRHFVIVTAYKDQSKEEDAGGTMLEGLIPTRSGGAAKDVNREERYDKLRSRAQSVTNSLPRTGADTEVIRTRDEVLETLYYYYKSKDAPENFSHGHMTRNAKNGEYAVQTNPHA